MLSPMSRLSGVTSHDGSLAFMVFPRTRPWFQKDRTQYEKTLDGSGPISGVLAQFHEDEHRGNHGHEQGPQENATQVPDATTDGGATDYHACHNQ